MSRPKKRKQVPTFTQSQFAARLSVFLKAGIPLVESLHLVKIIDCKEIIERISAGQTCSGALYSCYKVNPLLFQMIHIGERSGTLAQALEQASRLLQKNLDQKKKIVGAFIYPGFIAIATLGIAGFLVLYIFPKIIPLLLSVNIPLPLLTRVVMFVSDSVLHHWILLSAVFVTLLAVFVVAWKRFNFLQKVALDTVLRIPFIGSIFRGSIIAELFGPLHILLANGESLPNSLALIGDLTSHSFYSKILSDATVQVNNGGSLSDFFQKISQTKSRYIPKLISEMTLMGEKTGGIANACEHIVTIFSSEVDESLARLSQLIEPILMLCMGLIVGSIALSIILPIYEITNHLTK